MTPWRVFTLYRAICGHGCALEARVAHPKGGDARQQGNALGERLRERHRAALAPSLMDMGGWTHRSAHLPPGRCCPCSSLLLLLPCLDAVKPSCATSCNVQQQRVVWSKQRWTVGFRPWSVP